MQPIAGVRGEGTAKSADGRVTRPVVLGFPLSCRFFISPVGEATPTGGTLDIKTPQVEHLFKTGVSLGKLTH